MRKWLANVCGVEPTLENSRQIFTPGIGILIAMSVSGIHKYGASP